MMSWAGLQGAVGIGTNRGTLDFSSIASVLLCVESHRLVNLSCQCWCATEATGACGFGSNVVTSSTGVRRTPPMRSAIRPSCSRFMGVGLLIPGSALSGHQSFASPEDQLKRV